MATATEAFFALLTLAGLAYLLLALWSARAFYRQPLPPALAEAPGISLLKPLHGLDAALDAALASHCCQIYAGPVEILCGV